MTKGFQAKRPIKPGSPVDKYKRIFESANQHLISKSDVEMYHVKILRGSPIDSFTARSCRDCCVSADGDREFAVVNVTTILRSREKMAIFAKRSTSRNAMQLLGRPTGLCIQGIRSITQSNQGGRLVMCVEKFNHLGCIHTFDGIQLLTFALGTRWKRGPRNRLLEEKLGKLSSGHVVEAPGAVN